MNPAQLPAEVAWSKVDTLDFDTGVANSGTGNLVVKEAGGEGDQGAGAAY